MQRLRSNRALLFGKMLYVRWHNYSSILIIPGIGVRACRCFRNGSGKTLLLRIYPVHLLPLENGSYRARRVGWVGTLFILLAGAILHVWGTTIHMDVVTPIDLQRFVDAMEGNDTKGTYNVTWYGRQQIHEVIEVSDGKHVTITGVARLGTAPAAANDEGDTTGLFFVHGGSTLILRSIGLDGGSSARGGAVYVKENSEVNVFDSAFTNNNASNGGDMRLRPYRCDNFYHAATGNGLGFQYCLQRVILDNEAIGLYDNSSNRVWLTGCLIAPKLLERSLYA